MAKLIYQTYNANNCTEVGYRYCWSGGRLTATKRSRWQGSRDGVRISLGTCILSEAPDVVKRIEAERIRNCCSLEEIYPVSYKGWIVH